jgi:hypothetical protein
VKFPSEDYSEVVNPTDRWLGPCADSFCYASCDSPDCKWDRRLGDTPKKHNEKLREMKEEELESCLKRIIGDR